MVMFFKMNTERYFNFIIFSLTILLFKCVAQKVKASFIYLQFMFKIYIYAISDFHIQNTCNYLDFWLWKEVLLEITKNLTCYHDSPDSCLP